MVASIFTALSDPTRLRIVELLRTSPQPVHEISQRLPLGQPQTSKHLRVLRDAGLVAVRPKAQQRIYELRAEPMRELDDWIDRFRSIWETRFSQMDDVIADLRKSHTKRRG